MVGTHPLRTEMKSWETVLCQPRKKWLLEMLSSCFGTYVHSVVKASALCVLEEGGERESSGSRKWNSILTGQTKREGERSMEWMSRVCCYTTFWACPIPHPEHTGAGRDSSRSTVNLPGPCRMPRPWPCMQPAPLQPPLFLHSSTRPPALAYSQITKMKEQKPEKADPIVYISQLPIKFYPNSPKWLATTTLPVTPTLSSTKLIRSLQQACL